MTQKLLFLGNSGGYSAVWVSDGTTNGTVSTPVNQTTGNGSTSLAGNKLNFPGPVLFYANNKIYAQSGSGPNLLVWSTHGSSSVSHWTNDVLVGYGPAPNYPANQTGQVNPQGFVCTYSHSGAAQVYFNGIYEGGEDFSGELFRTDGTKAGTQAITTSGLNPSTPALGLDDYLYFGGNYRGKNVLMAYDGSNPPRPAPGTDGTSPPFNPQSVTFIPLFEGPGTGAGLFMSGQNPTAKNPCLYFYEGTQQPPINIDPTHSGLAPYNFVWSLPNPSWGRILNFDVPFYNVVFFSGRNDDGHRSLWVSLGTKDTTARIPVQGGGAGDIPLYPFNLTAINGKLYFTGQDTNTSTKGPGRGLFVYDPATNPDYGYEIINSAQWDFGSAANIFTTSWGDGSLCQTTMTAFNNNLYFSAAQGINDQGNQVGGVWSDYNLWRTNDLLHGDHTPVPVASDGQNGLHPFELTSIDTSVFGGNL
jgi:hypothetical protein